jgi:transcription termination/antitermination protein NusG
MCAVQRSASELLVPYSELTLDELLWFAVQTRPRFEKKVNAELQEKGIEAFLPLRSALHHWSDRQRLIHQPLFPGYVFVRSFSTLDARVAVLRTNGVDKFVGVRGIGTPIPDFEIEAMRKILEEKIPIEPYPYLKLGQFVRIRGGALDGIRGILTRINGDQSLIISVELIQRSIAMRVTGYDVEAA